MRFIQLALCCLFCVAKSSGQTVSRSYHTLLVVVTKEKKRNSIYTKAELSQPVFPRGDTSWIQSLQDTLNHSIERRNKVKAGTYIVSIRFLIEKNGSISDIVCLKDPGFDMCKQVKDALRRKFRWGPQTDSSEEKRQYDTTSTTHDK